MILTLSDDQTLPNHQLCAQSEPGTVERQAGGTRAKDTASTKKLNRGEWSGKRACVCSYVRLCTGAIFPCMWYTDQNALHKNHTLIM